ncbi:transcription factor HES-2 isoform X2 [Mirounga angustirostris]|uniref:transcription factor HES-2 isoform X2 n=1 Tax=Mirounga angustirostris TaxID=9716 RepID=UPI00313C353E
MAPTHTPAGARVRRRPATPPQMGCGGQERHPGGSAVPDPPLPGEGTKAGGGTRRQPDSVGRDGAGRGGAGDTASLKPGGWRGAHPSGAGSCSARDFPSGLGLCSVCARAQVSYTRGPQRRRFPAEHGAASESGGPGGAAQEPEAAAGEAPPRAHQRKPEAAQGAHPAAAGQGAPSDSYGEGYRACLARLARVLPACRVLEPAVSARLLEHLRRRAAGATPDGARAGDSCGAAAPSPPPAPAPAPPAPPRGPGLWRPW